MKFSESLSQDDIFDIEACEIEYVADLEAINEARSLKLGDVVIKQITKTSVDGKKTISIEKNTNGAVRRFKVTHIGEGSGFAYVQELKLNGYGTVFSVYLGNPLYALKASQEKFILDPDYIDSLILHTEYDPLAELKTLNELKKDITAYNSSIMIDTKDKKEFAAYLLSLRSGHVLYRSSGSNLRVESVVGPTINKKTNKPILSSVKINILTQYTKMSLTLDQLSKYKLYSAPPRSFSKETKNPKQ